MTAAERRKHSVLTRAQRAKRDIERIIESLNKAYEVADGYKTQYLINESIRHLWDARREVGIVESLNKET